MLNELFKEQRKLNTITKYPSILTYHELGNRGTVTEEMTSPIKGNNEVLEATEKVDGTNSRIIICGKDYLIGTREDFIYAKGDRIQNDKMNILKECIPRAERLISNYDFDKNELFCIYGENYGKGINKGFKNYAINENNFRVFDMWKMPIEEIKELINTKDLNSLSTWRENGGQPYISTDELKKLCHNFKLEKTPVLFTINSNELPTSVKEMYDLLSNYKETKVNLDTKAGKSEGFVIRNNNRNYIKKVRFEEYEKTLKVK